MVAAELKLTLNTARDSIASRVAQLNLGIKPKM
jgi:hypothetical protein